MRYYRSGSEWFPISPCYIFGFWTELHALFPFGLSPTETFTSHYSLRSPLPSRSSSLAAGGGDGDDCGGDSNGGVVLVMMRG